MLIKLFKQLFMCAFIALLVVLINSASALASTTVKGMRLGNQPDGARVVFDMDKNVGYHVFLLDSPKRVVVDFDDVNITGLNNRISNQIVSAARIGNLSGNNKRVVIDLSRPAIVKKAFIMAPQEGMSWRLVIDLLATTDSLFRANLSEKNTKQNVVNAEPQKAKPAPLPQYKQPQPVAVAPAPQNKVNRRRIIVLDPGHGGKDPGAVGAYGRTYEKNVTLSMGKELKQLLQQKGYVVYLTRENDIFIPLRQRIKIAQKYKADLFMSIHADSAQNKSATGLSVYTLSDTASDQEAAALAERENKADIIGGIDLGGNTKEVNDILISLSQTDTRNKSSKYATYLVQEMAKSVKLVRNTHRFAGFAVLKAPDVPAALLEMGYLSNRTEEANLKTPSYRRKLADAVARAVDKYFKDPEIASN